MNIYKSNFLEAKITENGDILISELDADKNPKESVLLTINQFVTIWEQFIITRLRADNDTLHSPEVNDWDELASREG